MRAVLHLAAALVASIIARPVLIGFGIFVAASLGLAVFIGRDFFPTVDSGQMRLHARAPVRHAHRGDRGASSPISNARSAT